MILNLRSIDNNGVQMKCYFCQREQIPIIGSQIIDCIKCQEEYNLGSIRTILDLTYKRKYSYIFDKHSNYYVRLELFRNVTVFCSYNGFVQKDIATLEGFPITLANFKQKLSTLMVFN